MLVLNKLIKTFLLFGRISSEKGKIFAKKNQAMDKRVHKAVPITAYGFAGYSFHDYFQLHTDIWSEYCL